MSRIPSGSTFYNMIYSVGNKNTLLPLLGVNFIGTLGFSIILPFLVYLIADLGGNALIYGVVGATYSAFEFIGGLLYEIMGAATFLVSGALIVLVFVLGLRLIAPRLAVTGG